MCVCVCAGRGWLAAATVEIGLTFLAQGKNPQDWDTGNKTWRNAGGCTELWARGDFTADWLFWAVVCQAHQSVPHWILNKNKCSCFACCMMVNSSLGVWSLLVSYPPTKYFPFALRDILINFNICIFQHFFVEFFWLISSLFAVFLLAKPGLSNSWPMGHIQPTKVPHAAHSLTNLLSVFDPSIRCQGATDV